MKKVTILLVGLVLLFFGCSKGLPPEFKAPDFLLKSPVTGEKISLAKLKGRPIMIYWFASW